MMWWLEWVGVGPYIMESSAVSTISKTTVMSGQFKNEFATEKLLFKPELAPLRPGGIALSPEIWVIQCVASLASDQ
eukprot:760433-Hanusia_phi.AAC.1